MWDLPEAEDLVGDVSGLTVIVTGPTRCIDRKWTASAVATWTHQPWFCCSHLCLRMFLSALASLLYIHTPSTHLQWHRRGDCCNLGQVWRTW